MLAKWNDNDEKEDGGHDKDDGDCDDDLVFYHFFNII